MNPHTGEIAYIGKDEREGFERLPDALQKQALMKLRLAHAFGAALAAAGMQQERPTAQVNLRGHTPLAQWAKKKRKAKIAAASRRRNRK